MARILVTGGAGFLGSHLCKALLNNPDHQVIALDNLMTGKKENLSDCFRSNRFELIQWDVQNAIDLQVDQIYHAACPASPKAYQHSPTNTIKTCVLGMINMLELAEKHHAKLLQFSTSEVYGDPTVHPQPETYWGNVNPIGVRSCYDEGKRCAESLCFDYHREYGTSVKVVRIFNTYGPGMDVQDGRVISTFIHQALQNEPITIYGDGRQTRSLCYVDDLIEAIQRMMNDTGDTFAGPVNLGNPEEISMLSLAQKILELTHSSSRLVFLPLPGDDPTQRKPDISLAMEQLHWKPRVSLEEGLKKTIRSFAGVSNAIKEGGL